MSELTGARYSDFQHRAVLTTGIMVVLLLVAALVACTALGAGQRIPDSSSVPSSMHIPAGWHLYRDPQGYFTIALPPGWQVQGGTVTGHGEQSDAQGAANTTNVLTNFLPPKWDSQDSSLGLGVFVSYTLYTDISGNFRQRELCGLYTKSDTKINGVPAVLEPPASLHIWAIGTSAATYQISYGLPSDRPHMAPGIQTPVPQATVTADQQLAEAILATFTPIPATPPKC